MNLLFHPLFPMPLRRRTAMESTSSSSSPPTSPHLYHHPSYSFIFSLFSFFNFVFYLFSFFFPCFYTLWVHGFRGIGSSCIMVGKLPVIILSLHIFFSSSFFFYFSCKTRKTESVLVDFKMYFNNVGTDCEKLWQGLPNMSFYFIFHFNSPDCFTPTR